MWAAHLFAVPFQTVTFDGRLPIPIPEIVWSVWLLAALWMARRVFRRSVTALDLAVGLWLAAVLAGAAGVWARGGMNAATVRDALAAVAMAGLYVSIRLSATTRLLTAFPSLFVFGAAVAAALGIAGWALAVSGVTTPLALPASTAYLYLGAAARATGFTPYPGMLCSVLMIAALLLTGEWRRLAPWLRVALVAVIYTGIALTVSKSAVALAGGLGVVWIARHRQRLTSPVLLGSVVVGVVAIAYTMATHWALVPPSAVADMKAGFMVAGEPVATVDAGGSPRYIMRTNYAYNKHASLLAIREAFPLGIGPGQHQQYVRALRAEGRYPDNLWDADPHSSYSGTVAELGLFGLVAFVALWGMVVRAVARLDPEQLPPGTWASLAGVLAAMAIETIGADVMNFRHYWWIVGVVGAWAAASRRSTPAM